MITDRVLDTSDLPFATRPCRLGSALVRDSCRRGAFGGSRVPGVVSCALPLVVCAALAGGCTSEKAESLTVDSGGDTVMPVAGRATPPPSPRRFSGPAFTVVATGDVLLHDSVTRQARSDGHGRLDYRPVLASIKPAIGSADLALCHLETPLAPPGGPYSGYPVFSVPREIVPALADLGYDSCSTASNHTLDKGAAGVSRTLAALDQGHVRHAGSARSAAEAMTPTIMKVRGGVPVAHLAYSYGFNGFRLPAGKPWLANLIDPARIRADARRARRAGAKVVIVSLHWGTEYRHPATPRQVTLARTLLAMPEVDLIVGHHAHVVQPFGRAVNGKWVAYGLGNLVANQGPHAGSRHEGMIARFTFARHGRRWRVAGAELIPTFIDRAAPLRVLDVPLALRDPALPAERRGFLTGVAARTTRIARSRGADVRPAG